MLKICDDVFIINKFLLSTKLERDISTAFSSLVFVDIQSSLAAVGKISACCLPPLDGTIESLVQIIDKDLMDLKGSLDRNVESVEMLQTLMTIDLTSDNEDE